METDFPFPPEKIRSQLEKILQNWRISGSPILKSFLVFIVTEYLEGRANCLKEYTIGIKVLGKDITYLPKDDCIVRIHAVRLRKVLAAYYSDDGANDDVIISLPKGCYIPMVTKRDSNSGMNNINGDLKAGNVFHIAVLPFHFDSAKIGSFAEGLGIEISLALKHVRNLSVLSFEVLREIKKTAFELEDLDFLQNTSFFISGYVRSAGNAMRIIVNLTDSETLEVIWSGAFERERSLARDTPFSVQKELAAKVVQIIRRWMTHAAGKKSKTSAFADV